MPGIPHEEPEMLDVSSGQPGMVVNDIINEEHSLLHGTENYQSTAGEDEDDELLKAQKLNNGYAVPPSRLKVILVGMYMASFLSALDMTVVSTLLTTIASDLDAIPNMSWIATAYLLSSAAFQPLYGKLSDIFGRKTILIMCDIFFAVGCIICSFKSFPALVIGRFVTGMGGSGFNTVCTVSVSDIVPLRDRGVFQGIANIAFLIGAASGGILGGVIHDLLGWRWIFILQVPFTMLIGLAFYFFFNLPHGSPGLGSPGHVKEKLKRVDFLGSISLVSALMCILLAASLGNQYFSYTSFTFIGLIIGAMIALSLFVYIELNVAPEPILPITLMANRTVLSSSLCNWFFTMATFTIIFYYPIYLNAVIELPPSKVGLRVIGNFVGVAIGSLSAGIYMKKTGRYYKLTIFSALVTWCGIFAFNFLTPHTSPKIQMIMMTAPGFGYAIMLTVTLLALISAAPVKFQAGTTSIQYTFRSTGSTIGVSIASAIFLNVLVKTLNAKIPEIVEDPKLAKSIIERALKNTDFARDQPKLINEVLRSCYDTACKSSFHFATVIVSFGVVAGLFMRENKLHASVDRD